MTKYRLLLLLCLLISTQCLPQIAQAGALSPKEQQISDSIVQLKTEQLSLLKSIVNINSGTANINGVLQVGKKLQLQFDTLGFTTRWVEEPPSMHRAATLVATRQGTQGKRLLLIGHLDTVFPSDSPFQTYQQQGNTATGPGVIDDKGGDVVILYALKALQENHALDNTSITVVLTGDEEESGKPASISRKPLFDAAHHSDIALDFECANTKDTASTSRRGIAQWKLKTQGKEAHSSGIFQETVGYGANFELIRILNTVREQLSKEHYLTFNPGLLLGGTSLQYEKNTARGLAAGRDNVIANKALATGDLRFISEDQKLAMEKKIATIVTHHLPVTTASIDFKDGIPAMPPTPANLALLKQYSQVSNDLGYGPIKPEDPLNRGAGDISYIASLVSANLVGLGPLGRDAHSIKETMNIKSLTTQTQRAALLIYRLTR